MAVPSWKKRAEKRRPDLDDCIEKIKLLCHEKSKSTKSLGQLYVAALGLLYHLRLDQKTILLARDKTDKNEERRFPTPKDIPAMTAVLHNQSLFQTIIFCLSSNSVEGFETSTTPSSSGPTPQVNSFYNPGSRKRTLSLDKQQTNNVEAIPNKSIKLTHGQSPMVAKRTIGYATKPQMNIKVVMATILFVVMEPLDHWPVPIVEAYAEDCFGPRSWVDDPACRLLVQNLSLVHRGEENFEGSEVNATANRDSDATLVAEFYRSEKLKNRVSVATVSSTFSTPRASPTSFLNSQLKRGSSDPAGSISSKTNAKNEGDESDSGDEEEVAITTSFSKLSSNHDGSSSSSGEDEEMCVMNQRTIQEEHNKYSFRESSNEGEDPKFSSDPPPPGIKLTYPIQQQKLVFARVRQRYFGQNLQCAFLAVSEKLNERLDVKSKQNSGLLHCLPHFTAIPSVRKIITANLEKWFQSPALSGLARALFSKTVNSMKHAEPPLSEDLDALGNILRMRLKANQLNAHVENVTAVATKIPTASVTKYIYAHILREILVTINSQDSALSDHLYMIHTVHDALPDHMRANGIATAILDMLVHTPDTLKDLSKPKLMKRIQRLIQVIAEKFGSSFNACAILDAMLSFQVESEYLWTIRHEEYKARLMFQCATLLVHPMALKQRIQPAGKSVKTIALSNEEVADLKIKLIETRKLLIRWCCLDYAPLCSTAIYKVTNDISKHGSKKKEEIKGAGPANYESILDGVNNQNFPNWVNTIRCMLFLEKSDSPILQKFISSDGTCTEDFPGWEAEAKRIDFCHDYGTDVNDEMIWVVLNMTASKNSPTHNKVALLVLEHIFERCKRGTRSTLSIQDPSLISKLYELAEYKPATNDKVVVHNHENGNNRNERYTEKGQVILDIPRLGYPGMWWRVTGLALIMCGASPGLIGEAALETYPTLNALIKMITSDRYRFPTVDSDETAREEQKKIEQSMRDEEAKITEFLFAPTQKAKEKVKHQIDDTVHSLGARTSRRQQEKREQELKRQREKQEAEARMEASRKKKMLRSAQKSITIWDPKRGPRKPPKESADLIFSIGELFELPRVFQKSTEPDFVLTTIGSTSRGAIERAYDWLIPIISFFPETISRLPASASCFLLLRAYGTDGDEQLQLQELSAPLLQHVRDSLMGKFGEADSVRAFDLLLTDIASHNPDRRRCARRVLTNAIGKETIDKMDAAFVGSNHAWAINLVHVEHSKAIIANAVNRMGIAASFERGSNLRYLILALNKLTKFAGDKSVAGEQKFPLLLTDLLSRRPTIFAAALISYEDLRSLAIEVVADAFKVYVEGRELVPREGTMVEVSLCTGEESTLSKHVEMPLALLQSSCVLLSIWCEDDKQNAASVAIKGLVRMLMNTQWSDGDTEEHIRNDGLASAKILITQKTAISVESWVMLAKSRSDYIAKRAALAAPTTFVPRLLLCSGLPRASLVTMIDRLGRLGENAADREKTFNQLLVPSASSEWDLGRLGHRKEISRKLLGRISAYLRMYKLKEGGEEVSFSFVEWLSTQCQSSHKVPKAKTKKLKPAPALYATIESANALFDIMPSGMLCKNDTKNVADMEPDASDMTVFLTSTDHNIAPLSHMPGDVQSLEQFLSQMFQDNEAYALDQWLVKNFRHQPVSKRPRRRQKEEGISKISNGELSFLLLHCYVQLERKVEGIASILVKWVPKLSTSEGSPKFWRLLLADGQKPAFLWENLVARCLQTWDREHMNRCRKWILSEGKKEKLDLLKMVRLLIVASEFSTIHVESFVDVSLPPEYVGWGRTEEIVRSATDLALDCLLTEDYEVHLRSRNDPPECLVLLLLISKLGRNQVQLVSSAIMNRIQNNGNQTKRPLLLSLLRIYTYFPLSMNLGTAALRFNLMNAVDIGSSDWLIWRSPMDDSIEDAMDVAFSRNPSQRSTQSMIDAAKKHPLLLLRKIGKLVNVLEEDASTSDDKVGCAKGSVVHGETLNGRLFATVDGKKVQIMVKHWGYSYTEQVWMTALDVMTAMPNEVVFQCGLKTGMLGLMGMYLRLILVQSQLRTNTDRFSKLKERFSEILGEFRKVNPKSFDLWITSKSVDCGLHSLGVIRNVLVGCGIMSHQQAIESVRQSYTPSATK